MATKIFHKTKEVFVEKICQERKTPDGTVYYTPDLLDKDEVVEANEGAGVLFKNLRCMPSLFKITSDEAVLKRFVYSEEDLSILKPHKIN
jgi:hypothetical protein